MKRLLHLTCILLLVSCAKEPRLVYVQPRVIYTPPTSSITPQHLAKVTEPEDTTFCFLGMAKGREENFDKCPVPVTLSNVYELYRKYDVTPVEGTDLYMVCPKQIYTNSRYFTRLLRLRDSIQVASITFYCCNTPYIFKQGNKYMVALNSLATTSGYNTSTFTCKTLLLDKSLKVLKEREYRYKEQRDPYYAYAYIDTLVQKKNYYTFRIINSGFDSDDYYEYNGRLSYDNVVTSSSRKQVFVNRK